MIILPTLVIEMAHMGMGLEGQVSHEQRRGIKTTDLHIIFEDA